MQKDLNSGSSTKTLSFTFSLKEKGGKRKESTKQGSRNFETKFLFFLSIEIRKRENKERV